MRKGWHTGLASRFANHYYIRIKQDDIRSRCGQISLTMLRGNDISSLKLMKEDSTNNICQGCKNLLQQDEEQKLHVEPHRY